MMVVVASLIVLVEVRNPFEIANFIHAKAILNYSFKNAWHNTHY